MSANAHDDSVELESFTSTSFWTRRLQDLTVATKSNE